MNGQEQSFEGEQLERDSSSRKRADVGQDRYNIKSGFVLRKWRPKSEYSLYGLAHKWMFPYGDTVCSNIELGDGGSVEVHSAPFCTFLI